MERPLIAASSVPVLERPERDAPLVTELVVGERLEVLGEFCGWLRVVVPGHATGLDPRGYPGWTRPDGLIENPGWGPRLTVVAPNGDVLPLGALLRHYGESTRLPGGDPVDPEPGSVKLSNGPAEASPVGSSAGGCSACCTGGAAPTRPPRWTAPGSSSA